MQNSITSFSEGSHRRGWELNKTKVLVTFAMILILSISLTYYIVKGTVESGGTYYLDIPFGDASYYVGKFSNGSTWMVNGDTWQCEAVSTDASQIINWASGNLTSGRTWKEKIVVKDDFIITNTVKISSYTILEIDGKWTLANGVNKNVIENLNLTSGDTSIEIRGGRIDGNGANQNAGSIIYWSGVQDGIIEGMYLESSYNSIIKIVKPSGVLTETNRIFNNRIRTSTHKHGIEAPYDCSIFSNYIDYNKEAGIYSFSSLGAGGLLISDNHLWGNLRGIWFKGSNDNSIIANYIEFNYWEGIYIESYSTLPSDHQQIIGNCLKQNSREGANLYNAIYLKGLVTNPIWNIIINDNRIYDATYHKHAIFGEYVAYATICNNVLQSYSSPIISGVDGPSSIIKNNRGFVTENYVSATNTTATTFVFNHGLAGTPDFVCYSFNTTAITGHSWTSTSTQITVTVTGSGLPEIMACYCQCVYEP